MNLRIQTYGQSPHLLIKRPWNLTILDDVNVQDVLEKGLNDLMDLCDVVLEKFVEARDYAKEHNTYSRDQDGAKV